MRWSILTAAAVAAGIAAYRGRAVDLERHFADQGCIVTGGGSGFGRETARRLAGLGARVLVVDRDAARLEALCDQVPALHTLAIDITAAEAPAQIVAEALRVLGRVDLLYNNAGIAVSGPFIENTPEQIAATATVNFTAHLQLTRQMLPVMIAQGGGDIAFTASLASWVSAPSLAVYSGTKAGIKQFARALEREVGAQGIRVFGLYPNVVRTNLMPGDVFDLIAMKYGIGETIDALLKGLARGQRDIFVNRDDRFLQRFEQLAPRLLDRVIARRSDAQGVMQQGVRDGRASAAGAGQ